MASSVFATTTLLITFNLLFFTMVTSTYVPCPPPPSKIHKPPPTHPKSPPSPVKPKPPPSPVKPKPPPSPTKPACPPPSIPIPKSPPSPTKPTSCPIDTLKLGVCGNLLNDLVHIIIGTTPSNTKCCGLINGLTDVDAAVCLCTAIKAKVLGINLNAPVSLTLLLNYCGKGVPSGFKCA